MSTAEQNSKGKTLNGTVVSTKMQKTVTVLIETKQPHPKYKKYISHSNKVHARLPEGVECNDGDFIEIIETRPMSKTVAFAVSKIIKKAEVK